MQYWWDQYGLGYTEAVVHHPLHSQNTILQVRLCQLFMNTQRNDVQLAMGLAMLYLVVTFVKSKHLHRTSIPWHSAMWLTSSVSYHRL